jgi:hypothetical protein
LERIIRKQMKIKNIIKVVWELPQNALGAIVKNVSKAEFYTKYKDANVYCWKLYSGMSLGKYIFVPSYYKKTPPENMHTSILHTIKHEYGHTVQSKYLGWFYLLVIGAPSLIWCTCFEGYRTKTGKSYYDFYTESWANKLGDVER